MSRFRRRLGWWIAEVAKSLVRLGVWVSGTDVQIPTKDDYQRFEAWDSKWNCRHPFASPEGAVYRCDLCGSTSETW